MTLVVEVNGSAIANAIAPSSVTAQSRAEDGDTGFGGFAIDDPGAAITTTGHHVVTIEESSCSQPRLFTGYLTDRDTARSLDRGLVAGDDARLHDATAVDLNAVFSFVPLQGAAVIRPEETMDARLTWLLGHESLSPFIADTGFVSTYTLTMDAADYTGATPRAVLDDIVERAADTMLTYFAFWDSTAEAVGLYFGAEGTGISESSLAISNVLADVNGTTIFAPDAEATLTTTPEEVYSEVVVVYSRGTKRTFRKRPATETAFGIARGTTIERPYTGRETTAQSQADRFLTSHATERQQITTAIIVPPESAGLAVAGQRIDVKFSHLAGYEDWTSMRIVTSTITPVNDVANRYRVELVLALPTPAPTPPTADCDGTAASNAFNGIAPTYSSSNVINTPVDLAECNDGDITSGAYWANSYKYPNNWKIRNFTLTLPEAITVDAVTIAGRIQQTGFAAITDDPLATWGTGLWGRLYVVFDGATEYEITSGTTYDADIWTYMGDEDLERCVTLTFDEPFTFTTLTVSHRYYGTITQQYHLDEVAACAYSGGNADEAASLGTTPYAPVTSPIAPTVNDDASAGYVVGQTWVDTTTGTVYTLVDSTTGAAVWVSAGQGDYVSIRDGGMEEINLVASSGSTLTLDLGTGNVHDVTLDDDCTLSFAGATAGVACSFTLLLRQDTTGGWTTTWPGSVVWADGSAPTLDETAETLSVLTFLTVDGGTTWYGFPTGGSGTAGTPALTLGTSNAAGSASTFVATDASIAVFDATAPTTLAFGGSAATGSAGVAARRDHSHGMPAEPSGGELLISDTPSTPLVFADILQNEAQDDLLYSD